MVGGDGGGGVVGGMARRGVGVGRHKGEGMGENSLWRGGGEGGGGGGCLFPQIPFTTCPLR